ncbi:hypothetical protein BGZ52_008969 [Haplosporangium bisporale]|nr:hypothetical protein BGZ52_008969 [Haplosporangium bisporale]
MTSRVEEARNGSSTSVQDSSTNLMDPASLPAGISIMSHRSQSQKSTKSTSSQHSSLHGERTTVETLAITAAPEGQEGSAYVQPIDHPDQQTPQEQQEQEKPLQEGPPSPSKSTKSKQSLITKALLSYLNFFRVVQPLASIGSLATISPVLAYFRSQTIFPVIQATLYVYTASLATCSVLFSLIYLVDVIYHKPLFWPHFWKRRQVIAERLRERLTRRRRQHGASPDKGKTPASDINNSNNVPAVDPMPGLKATPEIKDTGAGTQAAGRDRRTDSRDCQGMEGEVGLTGIICRYDDETSTLGAAGDSRRESRVHPSSTA